MRPRLAILCLALAALLPTSCRGPALRIGEIKFHSTYSAGGGQEYVRYEVSLVNHGAQDVDGAFAMVTGEVVGAELVDGVLVFYGPIPAGATVWSQYLIVQRPVGAPFDPATLVLAVVPGVHDRDVDGLSDGEELDRGTDPARPDSDGDRMGDAFEVFSGTNPNDASDRPYSFYDSIFYAAAARDDGEPTLAVGGFTWDPVLMGRPGPGIGGLAFDRHGFLHAATGPELLRLDPFTGARERAVPLLRETGAPVSITRIAYEPGTSVLYGVVDDPDTGAPTTELVAIDPATGLVAAALMLPVAPLHLAFDPFPDPADGHRALHLVVEHPDRGGVVHVVRFPDGDTRSVEDTWLPGIAGIAFDRLGNRVLSWRPDERSTEVFGGVIYASFSRVLTGLAIPPACPAPCPGRMFDDGVSAFRTALGDLDGDGHLDLVGAVTIDVTVYRNDGTGQLAAGDTVLLPRGVAGIAAAQLDADATVDVAALTEYGDLFLLPGDGTGGLGPPVSLGTMEPYPLVAGDVTGDAVVDLVTGGGALVNDGVGQFAPGDPLTYEPFGHGVHLMALAHVDGDGRLDVVTANERTYRAEPAVATFRSDGHGGFTETSRQPLPFWPLGLGTGDLDGDGLADAVVVGVSDAAHHVVLLRNTGGGLGPPEPVPHRAYPGGSPAIGDVTGDGLPDVVIGGGGAPDATQVLVGDGRGGLRPSLFDLPAFSQPDAVDLVDFDGDGANDVLLTGFPTQILFSGP